MPSFLIRWAICFAAAVIFLVVVISLVLGIVYTIDHHPPPYVRALVGVALLALVSAIGAWVWGK